MTNKSVFNANLGFFTPIMLLVVLSLITLFSINIDFFKNQLIYLIFSIVVFLFFSQLNYKILKFYSLYFYLGSIISLFLVLLLGLESRGAIRWFDVFGIKIQFSEIIKPFLLISLASFISGNKKNFRTFIYTFLLLLPIILLIYKQPDLGNTIIFLLTVLFTLLICGFSLKFFAGGLFSIVVFSPFFWKLMHGYQKERIMSFVNLANDPLGISYNAIQSIIAVGSGMFFGKGFSQGTQSMLRFLPERQTDFIFATISENLGFVGSVSIVLCFCIFLYKLYSIYIHVDDEFSKVFIVSSFSLIFVQAFINIGMNIGLIPVVGVTLPFVSSGGSSLLSNFILLSFISSVSKKYAQKNNTLEIC